MRFLTRILIILACRQPSMKRNGSSSRRLSLSKPIGAGDKRVRAHPLIDLDLTDALEGFLLDG